jgi:hypothetical protein
MNFDVCVTLWASIINIKTGFDRLRGVQSAESLEAYIAYTRLHCATALQCDK